MEKADKNRVENTISKLRTVHDMMEIIMKSIEVSKRALSATERYTNKNNATEDSLRSDLKIIEYDIITIKKEVADTISDQTDLLNNLKEENKNEH